MKALREKLFPYLLRGLGKGATANPNDIVARTPELGIQAMNMASNFYTGQPFRSPGGQSLRNYPSQNLPHVTPAGQGGDIDPGRDRPLSGELIPGRERPLSGGGGGRFEPRDAMDIDPAQALRLLALMES
jgi:hypothetical protein